MGTLGRPQALAVLWASTLGACAAVHPPASEVGSVDSDAEPTAALSSESESVQWDDRGSPWGYVAARYDQNQDGRVSFEEYGRDAGSFGRMDRNADGLLAAEDFVSDDGMLSFMRGIQARWTVASYFQANDEDDRLTMDELFEAAEAFDQDGDELCTEAEFRALAETVRRAIPAAPEVRMMGAVDPWTSLVEGIDRDGDGQLAFAELGTFFEASDLDGDFAWNVGEGSADSTGEASLLDPNRVPSSGPKVGTLAPDFLLSPPEGGTPVQLSSFRGDRPVALVFGSAT